MTVREAEIIELIHKEVKPALGCTEPIAVALAAAKAAEILCDSFPETVKVEVSGNILKNGMGVGIPGTDMIGLHIAAALGAIYGRSSYGPEVLKDIQDKDVEKAKGMVRDGKVEISLASTSKLLYVKVTLTGGGHSSC